MLLVTSCLVKYHLSRSANVYQNVHSFTGSENPDFGFSVEIVNGVAGNVSDHTCWEILSDTNGTLTPTPVGEYRHPPVQNISV